MDGGKLDVLENRINEAMERLQLVLAKSDVSNIVQIQQLEDVDETSLPTHVLDTVADKVFILFVIDPSIDVDAVFASINILVLLKMLILVLLIAVMLLMLCVTIVKRPL
eukprot:TRINITY_DN662_c1_g4_i2.p1 TRINITY_DN662_c1_g4~~TRINITY_DN662_c1_g4_i2.p1  ORF type:complete len:118 (-),score=24.66 TRINITY_DN662_c1_g4_i2:355-681(-)